MNVDEYVKDGAYRYYSPAHGRCITRRDMLRNFLESWPADKVIRTGILDDVNPEIREVLIRDLKERPLDFIYYGGICTLIETRDFRQMLSEIKREKSQIKGARILENQYGSDEIGKSEEWKNIEAKLRGNPYQYLSRIAADLSRRFKIIRKTKGKNEGEGILKNTYQDLGDETGESEERNNIEAKLMNDKSELNKEAYHTYTDINNLKR